MRWIYLSPHFDDVALSCGGLVWEQERAGDTVEAWTVCAGAPDPREPLSAFAQSLHERWETGPQAVSARLTEDAAAMRWLGCAARYWDLPDCIYRRLPGNGAEGERWLVNGEEDLWQHVNPAEEGVIARLTEWLARDLQAGDALVSPLTLGNHVDHFLTRAAAERAAVQASCGLWYYPDYPYVVKEPEQLVRKVDTAWQQVCWTVSTEALKAWQEAVACYTSQISTFWNGRAGLDAALADYWQSGGGTCLWRAY